MPNKFLKSTSPSILQYISSTIITILCINYYCYLKTTPKIKYFLPNAILGRGLFRQIVKNSWDKWDSPNASFSMKALLLLVIFIGKEQIDLLDAL